MRKSMENGTERRMYGDARSSGANLTHVVVVKPKFSGINNSSYAVVTYQKSEKSSDAQVNRSEAERTVVLIFAVSSRKLIHRKSGMFTS